MGIFIAIVFGLLCWDIGHIRRRRKHRREDGPDVYFDAPKSVAPEIAPAALKR